jgi:hypothetical protein
MAQTKNKNPWEILVQGVGVNLDALKAQNVTTAEGLEKTKIFEHLSEEKRNEAHAEVLKALAAEPDVTEQGSGTGAPPFIGDKGSDINPDNTNNPQE